MIRALALALAALAALPAAGPAVAAPFVPPAGCVPLASVQHRLCEVSLYWRCGGQPGYVQATATADGLGWVTVRDGAGQWLEMRHLPSGFALRTQMPPADPSDHRALLDTGSDSYLYTMASDPEGGSVTYRGTNRVIGPAEIAGRPVTEIAFDYRTEDASGAVEGVFAGTAYLFGPDRLSIYATWARTDGADGRDALPVEILTEGQPGFMDATPRHDCGGEVS